MIGTSTGIQSANTINNFGTITTASIGGVGDVFGINAISGPVTVNNSGTIGRIDIPDNLFDSAGISGTDGLVVTNTSMGVIQGSIGIEAAGTPTVMTVTNSGLISGIVGGGGQGIFGDTVNLTNNSSGTITGDAAGVQANTATIFNYGTISGPSLVAPPSTSIH